MANTTCLVILLSIVGINNVISASSFDACKKTSIVDYTKFNEPLWRMDDSTLKHVTLQKNASGITHFEMHLAVKSQDFVDIMLTYHPEKLDDLKEDFYVIHYRSVNKMYVVNEPPGDLCRMIEGYKVIRFSTMPSLVSCPTEYSRRGGVANLDRFSLSHDFCMAMRNNGSGEVLKLYGTNAVHNQMPQFGPNYIYLYKRKQMIFMKYTPNLISWTNFTQLYVKIVDGSLIFGTIGQPALAVYTDATTKTMKYFTFGSSNSDASKPTEIYFDCP